MPKDWHKNMAPANQFPRRASPAAHRRPTVQSVEIVHGSRRWRPNGNGRPRKAARLPLARCGGLAIRQRIHRDKAHRSPDCGCAPHCAGRANGMLTGFSRRASPEPVIHSFVHGKAALSRFARRIHPRMRGWTGRDRRGGARRRVSRVLSRPLGAGGDGHSSGTPVAERLMRPTRAAARRPARHRRIAPGRLPLLLGLAPGGVFPAAAVAGGAVRSYRTVSPLPPAPSGRRQARRCPFCGTVPGVAPAGRYPAPHLRGARTFLSPHRGEERPSSRLAQEIWTATTPLSKAEAESSAPCCRDRRCGHGVVSMPTAAPNFFLTFPPKSGLTRRVVLPAVAATAVAHAM